jgi:very-short-patch-repair endonuclease
VAGTEQRDKVTWPIRDRADTRSQAEYVAKLVSVEEVFHFVRSHGGGDGAASWVAGRQLALITSGQLAAARIGKDAIAVRRGRQTLHRVHHGVYLWGQPIMLPGAHELAAVLACGDGAVISHRSAAVLWRLVPPFDGDVEVTVVGRHCRSRRGIRVHRSDRLDPRDQGYRRGIPIITPARTLIDLASEAGQDELERAIAEAYALGLVTDEQIEAAVDRAPNRNGVARLRGELRREGGPQWTQSEGERRMLKLIRAAGLPAPQTQARIAGWPADFLWAEQRLIVEVDGYPFHSHRRAFERDRRRDQAHIAAGYTVIRFTMRQLSEEPLVVITTIVRALERGSSRPAVAS